MMYEVEWIVIEINFMDKTQEQVIYSEQFKTMESALEKYQGCKVNPEVEHARITMILDEYSR